MAGTRVDEFKIVIIGESSPRKAVLHKKRQFCEIKLSGTSFFPNEHKEMKMR